MNATFQASAADRGSVCNDQLGPSVPDSVMHRLQAYGDSRADDDGNSDQRIGEAVIALRHWAAQLQTAERDCRTCTRYTPHHRADVLHCSSPIGCVDASRYERADYVRLWNGAPVDSGF